MKEYIAVSFVAAILFSVSPVFAQQEKSPADKYQNNPLVYAELAKAPEKARAKRNPLETDPEASPLAGSYLNSTVRSAMAPPRKAARRGRASAARKFRAPRRARYSGF